ncbi:MULTISPECIES: peptide deformylase [Pseudothermotoga]|jgi:peptide deformylase|uniref:Peptide deformylase n=1 Tax=Pseudothermotoga lettingae (strain ATCC BAA-301 / DSM 14385 / NBRC 107922 / TMO) TaxID=416591 RepID=DEF_PSELT|nr:MULTISPECIES: peptide deformylase [Pseudothermotoga]A8F524.1 RecName: Full=Peptide deformylase; Short=PDF; AltName: Full=Polypeptide deformylase [Pseudothermotoga lettingae TMO]ABV33258.1 peptide deformylase [Pseudothermotoga lettingae TMO]MDI3493904.1 peptide deformylase [Pseudothermotoga sp.]MDK2884570.1 peptide deformylase [Pseudothermotoga sp.]GLI49825.1 peptide deformylase [Pseudothermotoga lettingae TMO]HBJ80417.1 peptide deformylase [Pseudothermotoga sp.]
MVKKIRLLGDPVLRKKSKNVERVDETTISLIKDLFETMYATDGIGLAAPQIGVSLRIFVMDDGKPRVFINPEIIYKSEEKEIAEEGCLSVPEVFEDVERSKEVTVRYMNEHGEEVEESFVDYSARVVQHEYDHLQGVLFIDLIPSSRRFAIRKKLIEIVRQSQKTDYAERP